MAGADRDVRLSGYEVYRFGGGRLEGDRGKEILVDFFTRLFEKHEIRGIDVRLSQEAKME
jgi:hypothetical protein